MSKELLTVSRMNALLGCPRKHYWMYEIGLRSDTDAAALRFGSAWHKAMEERWAGKSFDEALEAALPEGELDELEAVKLMALLAGYYEYYKDEPITELYPEIQFEMPMDKSRTFNIAGKIDGLGMMDGQQFMLEHKTTSDDIKPDSEYWLRLRFNGQVMQYLHAARANSWNPQKVIYDVTRKPSIKPKEVPVLDDDGKKIVYDRSGERVYKRNGEPRESSDKAKGFALQSAMETPEQYGERLAADVMERPEFYFARREVPVLDQDIEEFLTQRVELGKAILGYRQAQKRVARPEQAWPRNCNALTCRMCPYGSFCLQNISVDVNLPPAGFKVEAIHQELS